MKARFNYATTAAGVYDAMDALDQYLSTCDLDEAPLHFVRLRVSQINGCAYCLDMHWKDLRAIGETEQRLYSLDAWRESPPNELYDDVRQQLSEKELSDLTLAVATINAWNRLSIAARLVSGNYQPAMATQ